MNTRIRPRQLRIIGFRHLLMMMLAVMAMTVNFFLQNRPDKVEYGYSRTIFPYLAETISAAARFFPAPLSLTEFIAWILLLSIFTITIYTILATLKKRQSLLRYGLRWIVEMISIAAALYFIFWLLWGLNYLREPFPYLAEKRGTPQPLTVADYDQFAQDMAQLANAISAKTEDPFAPFDLMSLDALCNQAISQLMASTMNYHPPDPPPTKLLVFNHYFEAIGISGLFSPFLMEIHLNKNAPLWIWPQIMIHEKAHFMGFASERDAVLIAHLACLTSHEDILRYSSALLSLIAVSSSLSDDMRRRLKQEGLHHRVQTDLRQWREWRKSSYLRYARLHDLSTKVNHAYLKANLQTSGVRSYHEHLKPLIIWWKKYNTRL